MSHSKKRIKLDLDIVKKEPDQEAEEEEKDDDKVLAQTREESNSLEPENVFIKQEKEEEQVDGGEDVEGTDADLHEMSDANVSLDTEDDARSEFSTVKNKKNRTATTVRHFICTTCNYTINKLMNFTRHWLLHEEKSYSKENGVFVCQISDCFYVAPNKRDLLKHIASQHLNRYRCDFCYYVTYSEKDYDQHRTTHYTFQCVKCDLQSTKLFFVQDHVEVPLKCKKCDFTTHHWFPFEKHSIWHKHPPDLIVECGFCNFATGDRDLLEKHKAVHSTKFMPCKMCKFAGLNTAELSKHCENTHDTRLEDVDKLHKCKFCTCTFIGLRSKEKHEALHLKKSFPLKCCSNSTKVQCPYCEHQENQRDDMNLHIASKHAAELELENFRFENTSDETLLHDSVLKNFEPCDTADVDERNDSEDKPDADQKANLEDAAKTGKLLSDSNVTGHHTPENEIKLTEQEPKVEQRSNTCPFCYYHASSEEDYNAHYKTHTTFKCTRCTLECTKQLFVEDHTEKPWGCPKCDFKTHHWLLMKSHSFSHNNEQGSTLLRCSDCSYEAKTIKKLRDHLLTHTRAMEQALKRCRICSFETKYEETLRRHYSNRHNVNLLEDGSIPSVERPYECDLCACKFKEQVYLDKHRALHDKNGPFHLICRQCRQCKKMVNPYQTEQEKPDSWSKCPYCNHEVEGRYRMIQHLNRIHPSDLEIEGYRFEDGEKKEILPQIETMSYTALPQIQDTPHTINPDNTADDEGNCESTMNTEKFRMNIEEDTTISNDAGEGTSGSNQPGYILKRISKEHGQQMFRCNICGYKMKGKYIVEKHMDQKHPPFLTERQVSADDVTKEKRFSCAVCCDTAKTRYFIRKHMLSNHATAEEGNDFICNICGYRMKGKYIVEKHMDQKHPSFLTECQVSADDVTKEKILSCAVCCYTAKTRYFIRKHMLSNHATEEEGNDFYQIVKEEMESKDEIEIEENKTDSIHIEQIVVKVEPTSFSEEQSVENQKEIQIKQEPGLANALVPIYREPDKKWWCPVCPYNVTRKYFVDQHIEQKHKGCEKKTWFCTICPYGTKFKNSLRQHMERMHSAEQSSKVASEEIPCKQPGCDYKAPSVDELSTHMARHLQTSMQEVMVYKCELCSFGTVSKTIFKDHTKSCTGMPYGYQCYSCDFKSESRKGILSHIDTKHRYKYTPKKGYECLKCGYSSKEKSWKDYHRVNCHIKGEVEY